MSTFLIYFSSPKRTFRLNVLEIGLKDSGAFFACSHNSNQKKTHAIDVCVVLCSKCSLMNQEDAGSYRQLDNVTNLNPCGALKYKKSTETCSPLPL